MQWVFANIMLLGIVLCGAFVLYAGGALIRWATTSPDITRHMIGLLAIAAVCVPGLLARAVLERLKK